MDQQNPQVDGTKTDNVPVQPGSLKFAPVNPELGPIETLVPSIEIPNVEAEKPQEKQPEKITELRDNSPEPVEMPVPIAPKTATSKIIDKSKEPLHTHPLKNPKDALTKEADDEEEEFISQVEAAHEHK